MKVKTKTYSSKSLIIVASMIFVIGISIQAIVPGKEFQVNKYTQDQQWYPDTAMNGKGNFVVVWESEYQDKDAGGVFGQLFNSQGQKVGKEFRVNKTIESVQGSPAVAMDRAGNFVVVWESYAQDGDKYGIFGQRFNQSGKKVGKEFQVNTTSDNHQLFPDVAMDVKGNFVVTWTSVLKKKNMFEVLAQRFNKFGKPLGDEFQVNTHVPYNQWLSQISMDRKGNFIIVWESEHQDYDAGGVYAQLYSKTGSKIGDEFRVNTSTISVQGSPTVAMDIRGNFIVAWECFWFDGDGYGVFAKIFDSEGTALTNEFQVNDCTTNNQILPHVGIDRRGNSIIVWESFEQDSSNAGVYARRFNKDGINISNEFRVNEYTQGNQGSPRTAMSYAGNFVVVWECYEQDGDSYGVFARHYKK
ncbi:MAG: hypothetical protein JW755_00720 [Candidatus Aminicenantes bacterium]|nr:hypothetical protein [Candidatus Aminicenantes bacterium]